MAVGTFCCLIPYSLQQDVRSAHDDARASAADPPNLSRPSAALPGPQSTRPRYTCLPTRPYNQSWDWDSFFLGVALRAHGGLPFLAGTMRNFLHLTNATGEVQGCLTPQGPTGAIAHAKPVVIQGAWLAARGDPSLVRGFEAYRGQMEALLAYWGRPPRRDARTGLAVW